MGDTAIERSRNITSDTFYNYMSMRSWNPAPDVLACCTPSVLFKFTTHNYIYTSVLLCIVVKIGHIIV